MEKKLTDAQIEEMAFEIRRFLIDNRLWIDNCVYFNGKAFATFDSFDEGHEVANNDPRRLFALENVDVYERLRCEDDILSMSFEGPLPFFLGRYFPSAADILDCRDGKSVTALDLARFYV